MNGSFSFLFILFCTMVKMRQLGYISRLFIFRLDLLFINDEKIISIKWQSIKSMVQQKVCRLEICGCWNTSCRGDP